MCDCLSEEDLELLSNGSRRRLGTGLFEALEHLETCEKCRSRVELPTREEILKRFEESDAPSQSSPAASLKK